MNSFKITVIIAANILAFSCNRNVSVDNVDSRHIVVSIEPQRNILEHIIDSTYTVRTLLARDANPETFEPSMKERICVDSSEIYFLTGVLPFEKSLEESAVNTPFVNTSAGIDFIYNTHSHHEGEEDDHHSYPDPHYWNSINGARAIARNMVMSLISHFPTDSAMFASRLEIYETHLDSLHTVMTQLLAPHNGESFAVWHPSLSYFAREYGLKQISLGTEGKEMSAKGLKEAIDKAKNVGVRVFFFQKEFDSRQAISINEGIGSRIVEIYPMDYDWENQLKYIADEIAGAQ